MYQVSLGSVYTMMCIYRYLEDMPSGWIFIVSAILMRITEGIGWSMCTTITFSLLTQMFPNHVGTAVVSLASIWLQDCLGYGVGKFLHHSTYFMASHICLLVVFTTCRAVWRLPLVWDMLSAPQLEESFTLFVHIMYRINAEMVCGETVFSFV